MRIYCFSNLQMAMAKLTLYACFSNLQIWKGLLEGKAGNIKNLLICELIVAQLVSYG